MLSLSPSTDMELTPEALSLSPSTDMELAPRALSPSLSSPDQELDHPTLELSLCDLFYGFLCVKVFGQNWRLLLSLCKTVSLPSPDLTTMYLSLSTVVLSIIIGIGIVPSIIDVWGYDMELCSSSSSSPSTNVTQKLKQIKS